MSRRRHLTQAVGWATIDQRARLPRLAISLTRGPVAQLGARFHGMEEVVGSIPTRSTKFLNGLAPIAISISLALWENSAKNNCNNVRRLASRLLPFRANRLANIAAGGIETLAVVSMQFAFPLATGAWHEQMFPSFIFFGTIETVCTSVIVWKAWTWSGVEVAVSPERIVGNPEAEPLLFPVRARHPLATIEKCVEHHCSSALITNSGRPGKLKAPVPSC